MTESKKPSVLARIFARRNVTAHMAPPRHSPQLPPMPTDHMSSLVRRLYDDIEDAFNTGSSGWQTIPGYPMDRTLRYPLVRAITEAHKALDSDALHLFDEFPLSSNRNLIELIPAMRKALKTTSLQGVLTQEHVDAHRALSEMYTRSTTMWDKKAWEKLQRFLLQNLHQADAIVRIVEQRELYDPKSIADLLKLGDSAAPALADGLL